MPSPLKVIVRFLAFMFGAAGIFAMGCVGAGILWSVTYHRYDMPESGAYYSSVDGRFDSIGTDGSFFSFSFRGKTSPRWTWTYRTNMAYRSLTIDWSGESGEGAATLSLPSFRYQSSNSTGLLTRDTLATWLLGTTNRPRREVEGVNAVFGYLEAAGLGTLPPPRHHGYHFQEPVHGSIYHFLLGFGVPGLVYFWVAVWLFLVVFFGPRIMRGRARAQGAAPNGGPADLVGNSGASAGPPSVS
jgi:hypothetical protein